MLKKSSSWIQNGRPKTFTTPKSLEIKKQIWLRRYIISIRLRKNYAIGEMTMVAGKLVSAFA